MTETERFNASLELLAAGEWARAWPEYELRLTSKEFRYTHGRPELGARRWDGAPLDGRLYLHGEGGAGDALMMSRYIPLVRARVSELVVEVPPAIASLVRATYPDLWVVPFGDGIPFHHRSLSMMSLPFVFGTTVETVPPVAPFAVPLAPVPGRIGLCWRGSPQHGNDRNRSIDFEAVLRPLLDVPGNEWQSLQHGVTPFGLMPAPAGDFLEMAAAVASCELVITVDTSIAHLAGCLGVETRILLPEPAEWRWLRYRLDTPWYPSALLYRQDRPGAWGDVIDRLAYPLWAAGRRA